VAISTYSGGPGPTTPTQLTMLHTCKAGADYLTSFLNECHRTYACVWAEINTEWCLCPKMSLESMSMNSSGGLQKIVNVSQKIESKKCVISKI